MWRERSCIQFHLPVKCTSVRATQEEKKASCLTYYGRKFGNSSQMKGQRSGTHCCYTQLRDTNGLHTHRRPTSDCTLLLLLLRVVQLNVCFFYVDGHFFRILGVCVCLLASLGSRQHTHTVTLLAGSNVRLHSRVIASATRPHSLAYAGQKKRI